MLLCADWLPWNAEYALAILIWGSLLLGVPICRPKK